MMNLLAIDASTEACSVGLQTSEGEIFEQFEIAPRRHSELVLSMLDTVLNDSKINKNDINGCIVGIGPGAFTGIRIGIATAQGVALGLGIPCYSVSSLHAIAQQAVLLHQLKSQTLTAMIDARMNEIYVSDYSINDEGVVTPISDEKLVDNERYKENGNSTIYAGTGVECIKSMQEAREDILMIKACYPTATSLFKLYHDHKFEALSAEKLQASYVRNNVTYQNKPL